MITLNCSNKTSLAQGISKYWHDWNSQRTGALKLWAEIDSYIHATDTTQLEGGEFHDHSTHIRLVGEIYDDLVAIMYGTIFPHEDWLGWKGFDINAITKAVRGKVLSYIKQCHSMNGFNKEMRKCIDDLARYGNCFAQTYYKDNTMEGEDGIVAGYIGPAVKRISPFDIVFNPVATSFSKTPKIVRSLMTIGEFMQFVESVDSSELEIGADKLKEVVGRRTGTGGDYSDTYKEQQYIPSGFGSIQEYYRSGYIEVLWFYGDIFDDAEISIRKKRCVVVADRDVLVLDREQLFDGIRKGSWTDRPDNLWSQGPLDSIVGINFMVNHRENGKNDAIDKFIHPDRAYVGDVEEIYDEVTGHTKYILPEGGSVQDIRPDSTVLTYNNELMLHRDLARQSARLPQQLAGFRTAGEKTATEVQSLNDGAFRGFINKAMQFEEDVAEPTVQDEIRIAKDNFQSIIRVLDEDEEGIMLTTEITEEDLSANGKLIPMGSRRFSRMLQQQQGLVTLSNTQLGQMVLPHINTYSLARTVEELYGFEKYNFINKFASIDEQLEAQEKQMYAEQEMVRQSSQPTSMEMEMGGDEDDL